MANITFTIAGTFPAEDVLVYAKARGYQETVMNGIDADGAPIITPNPVSPEKYVGQFIKDYLVREIAGVSEGKIREEFGQTLNARLTGLYNSVKGNISVKI